MLTGQYPFPGLSLAAMIHHHVNNPVPLVSDRRSDSPAALDDVIQRATAKQPADRFPDILALAAAVRQAVTQEEAGREWSVPVSSLTLDIDKPNPYRGLRAFQEADAPCSLAATPLSRRCFPGLLLPPHSRQQDQAIPVEPAAGRFLAVVGPSGSGKSSVVKAGLISALRQRERFPDRKSGSLWR